MPKQTITQAQRERFLEALAETRNVTVAARAAGIARRAALALKAGDPDFAEAWADAEEEATDLLEHAARRRAIEGWEEPVYYHGQEIGRVRRFSEELMLLFLRAERPGKFGERPGGGGDRAKAEGHAKGRGNGHDHDLSGGWRDDEVERHGNLLIVPAELDAETWNRKAGEQQRKLMAGAAPPSAPRPSTGPG